MKINKKEMIITIDSELAVNGDRIGKELSGILGIPCYGSEILDKASEISGISGELMHRYDGRAVRAAYDLLAEDTASIRIAPAADFITAQTAAALQLASKGACILVDRHANAALKDNSQHVSIYIHADFEQRVKNYAQQKDLDEKSAARALKKADRAYRSYYRGNNKGWGEAGSYDLTVNTTGKTEKDAAEIIVSLLETLTGVQLHRHLDKKAG